MNHKYELSEAELAGIVGGSGTAAGMVAWARKAINEGWSYVMGGTCPGSVDAAGLISSYAGGAHSCETMFSVSIDRGPISSMPEIPGLGLYAIGRTGIYVGGGLCVEARNEADGIVLQPVEGMGWTHWFRIPGLEY